LSSLGKKYGKIIIPFNMNKHSRNLESKGSLLSGIALNKDKLYLHWEMKDDAIKTDGIIVGADTGINSVVTLSDHQQTKANKHNQTLNDILKIIVRRNKGSKGFEKAIQHRDNFINWSINQLNFIGIKEVRLEKISNFRNGNKTSKFLNYMGETLIRSKLLDLLQEQGVLVTEEESAYMSQRCKPCGYVYRRNRKGKQFSCKHCSYSADADYNASCNHELDLPSANFLLYCSSSPKKFFWKREGFFNLDGSEITVSDTKRLR
jgi:transposase